MKQWQNSKREVLKNRVKSLSIGAIEHFWKLNVKNLRCILCSASINYFLSDNNSYNYNTEDNQNVNERNDVGVISLLEPIALSIEGGTYKNEGVFLHAFYSADIPSIKVIVLPKVLCKVIQILSSWSYLFCKNLFRIFSGYSQNHPPVTMIHDHSVEDNIYGSIERGKTSTSYTDVRYSGCHPPSISETQIGLKNGLDVNISCLMKLHRLVMRMNVENKGFIEAHIMMSLTTSACTENKMPFGCNFHVGWLWILQQIERNEPAKLLVHSQLPPNLDISSLTLLSNKIADDIKIIEFEETKRQGNFFNLSLSLNNETSSSPSVGE